MRLPGALVLEAVRGHLQAEAVELFGGVSPAAVAAALLLDATGAFGLAQISLSPTRLAGAALLVMGVILIQKP